MSWSTANCAKNAKRLIMADQASTDVQASEEFLETALRWTPAQAVMQQRRRGLLAVITYHAIHDGERFDDHLDVLEEMGSFVSLEDVWLTPATGDRHPVPFS